MVVSKQLPRWRPPELAAAQSHGRHVLGVDELPVLSLEQKEMSMAETRGAKAAARAMTAVAFAVPSCGSIFGSYVMQASAMDALSSTRWQRCRVGKHSYSSVRSSCLVFLLLMSGVKPQRTGVVERLAGDRGGKKAGSEKSITIRAKQGFRNAGWQQRCR